jgi:cyclophilin family peptidyl-prolyl cis-trans isomerase/HEAT repeat protein
LRAAAARALGAFAQRKLTVSAEPLLPFANDADTEVRYAVAYALFRIAPEGGRAALVALAADRDAETRAIAIRGLVALKAGSEPIVARSLGDADWRVQVQAVRALAADAGTRGVLAAWAKGQKAYGHPQLEALALLAPHATEPEVAPLFRDATLTRTGPLVHSIAEAHLLAGRVRLGLSPIGEFLRSSTYPQHERVRLALSIIAEKSWVSSNAAFDFIRYEAGGEANFAAVAETAVGLLPDPRARDLVTRALRHQSPIVLGSVVDALADQPLDETFLSLAAARLTPTTDPEVALGLVKLLCGAPQSASSTTPALRAAHSHFSAIVRTAARECLTKLLAADPGPGVPSAAEPHTPVDPTRLLGHRVTWIVTTTEGDFVVHLDPDLAPWNVGTLTALAEKGFYNNTLWHRVVPDFVVQGGDPTGSGWGGPGYTVPAETSQRRYRRGTVGIADAGKDTGGSQWFVMHSAAPHLEQRYTIVGDVSSGMDVVDRLHVGDEILRIRVEIQ